MSSSSLQKSVTVEDTEIADTPAIAPNEDRPDAPSKDRANPARRAGIFVLLLLVISLGWHVMSDLVAPSSSSGAVTALTTQIAPRVSGQVAEVYVIDNQEVKEGQPLFTLDRLPFELAVRQAEVAYQQAQLGHDASTVNLAAAQAQVEQAQANLESAMASLERTKSLFERGIATRAQLDGAELQYSSAQSGLDGAKASLESAQMQLGVDTNVHPQLEAARLQLEQAKLNLEFATVVAPSDGVITNLQLGTGRFVGAGSPAMTFIDSEQPWVVVDLRENQLLNVDVGDEASILFDAAPGRLFTGKVRGIAWGIDPGRPAANGLPQNKASTRWFEPARTIPVQIELAAGEEWPRNVRAGSKAATLIFAESRNHPVAIISRGLQWVQSYISYLY